jgi:hypothetical protein
MEEIRMKLTKTNDSISIKGKEFTRLLGGFGDDKPFLTDKQIAELLGLPNGARQVRESINNNLNRFENGLHIIDLKGVDETDTLNETLISFGYSKQAISQVKNIYIFSEAGFLMYLKIADSEKSWELYSEFIEKYFKTVAQKKVLEKTVAEMIVELEDRRATLLGKMFMTGDTTLKMEYFNESEELNRQIQKHTNVLTSVKALDNVKSELALAESFTQSDNTWDIGVFSKIVNIDGLGRINMFRYFKDKKFIMSNNIPYQKYTEYFKIIPVSSGNGYMNNKLLIKPKGIKFIFDSLIKDGYIHSKTYEEIKKELMGDE